MLQLDDVRLRAVERADVPHLHEWTSDHDTWPLANDRAYLPLTLERAYAAYDGRELWSASPTGTTFAVESAGRLAGYVDLWDVDTHNRSGNLGIGLAPDVRGRGIGRRACRLLLEHAFLDRGLHRVQLDVLVSNERAVRCYRAAGFVEEGTVRQNAFVRGRMEDSLLMSVLRTDWSPDERTAVEVPGLA